MRKGQVAILVIAACAALSACKKDEPAPLDPQASEPVIEELPPGQPPTPPTEPPADATMPVSVSADAVVIGTTLGPDDMATGAKPSYTVNDTIYASARTPANSKGAPTRVYWTYQDGNTHKEEERASSGGVVNFRFTPADGMKPGKYNVEIDVNDVPIGIVDFVVR